MRSWLGGLGQNEFNLLVLVLDKFLLAAVAGFGAFAISRAMERYKRTQALALELGKVRAEAIVRAARNLALLEVKLWKVIGGALGTMALEGTSAYDMKSLRERYGRQQTEIIDLANKVGGQVADDLVFLGDEQLAVSAYFATLNQISWALANQTQDPEHLRRLLRNVPRAREGLAAFFPPLQRHRLRRVARLLKRRGGAA